MQPLRMEAVGDSALRVLFDTKISIKTNRHIRALTSLLRKENIEGVMEWVPTYTGVTVYYDPVYLSFSCLKDRLKNLNEEARQQEAPLAKIYHVPVCYGGDFGPDLHIIADHNQIESSEVIQLHTKPEYFIYMIGFTPGFPYLGGMDDELATPRLKTPRSLVPSGSVGIAGAQTGIYSLDSPGGWNIIGRTPVKLFDASKEDPVLFEAGHFIRFFPVTEQEFEEIEVQVDRGLYEIKWEKEREH